MTPTPGAAPLEPRTIEPRTDPAAGDPPARAEVPRLVGARRDADRWSLFE